MSVVQVLREAHSLLAAALLDSLVEVHRAAQLLDDCGR